MNLPERNSQETTTEQAQDTGNERPLAAGMNATGLVLLPMGGAVGLLRLEVGALIMGLGVGLAIGGLAVEQALTERNDETSNNTL